MNVHLVDGTYELFRHHFAVPEHLDPSGMDVAATRGVVGSVLMMMEDGATHVAVATDHVVESFRNDLYDGYKTSEGMDPILLAQFPVLEDALTALGTPVGCAATLIEHGWRDVEVHVVTHDLIVGQEPAAFFHSMSEWSAPVRPLTDRLDAAQMDRAAAAFAEVVAGSAPEGDRVPFSGLLSIGVPA